MRARVNYTSPQHCPNRLRRAELQRTSVRKPDDIVMLVRRHENATSCRVQRTTITSNTYEKKKTATTTTHAYLRFWFLCGYNRFLTPSRTRKNRRFLGWYSVPFKYKHLDKPYRQYRYKEKALNVRIERFKKSQVVERLEYRKNVQTISYQTLFGTWFYFFFTNDEKHMYYSWKYLMVKNCVFNTRIK